MVHRCPVHSLTIEHPGNSNSTIHQG